MSEQIFNLTPFVGGLNTEYSTVEDLPQCTSDELNCSIYSEGLRGRRFGINIERDGETADASVTDPISFQGFLWKNVGKTALDFIVYQVDNKLHFYNATSKPFSASKNSTVLDISKYIVDTKNFYKYPVKFISGSDFLLVVSKHIKPLKVSYKFSNASFEISEVDLKHRDFDGVDDGLKIDETPSKLTNFHKYNLLNQGWAPQQIEQVYKDKSYYPANNMQWFVGKDNSGAFNTAELLNKYFGNTPAPKGHYILSYFDRNRSQASGIYGGVARKLTYAYSYTWVRSRAYRAYVIKDFTSEFPSSKGTATQATIQLTRLFRKVAKRGWGAWSGNVTIHIDGLNSSGKWVVVRTATHYFYGTGAGEDGSKEVYIMQWENSTKYNKYRLRCVFEDLGNGSGEAEGRWPCGVTCVATLSIAEDGDPFAGERRTTDNRVTDVAYMAGKFFYLVDDTVLFSQTVTDEGKGYDKCYQDADPTSEEISDLLPTDGGYVKFQTMGEGMSLKTFNRGVLVFGRDIVYGLISPEDGRFTATEYDTVELSRAGLIGPQSVVSVANSVYYWSPLGIFRIGVNQQTGGTMVAENISQLTIQRYYNNIPQYAKESARAVFDFCNNRIYWFYPLDGEDLSKLNGVLMYDLNYGAFCPFKISDGGKVVAVFETVNSYEIEPTLFMKAGDDIVSADSQHVIAKEEVSTYNRFTAIGHCILTNDNKISFGDFNSREFIDWDSESYDSYMVSRPIMWESFARTGNIISGTYNNKQVPILQTLFKRTEEDYTTIKGKYIAQSGAYIRLRWGWSLTDKSNRWDMVQNAYRPQKDFMQDEYVESRMHVRGRGKSFQVEVRNDGNRDFRLAGINLMVRTR
jgi:hypothetical protein